MWFDPAEYDDVVVQVQKHKKEEKWRVVIIATVDGQTKPFGDGQTYTSEDAASAAADALQKTLGGTWTHERIH